MALLVLWAGRWGDRIAGPGFFFGGSARHSVCGWAVSCVAQFLVLLLFEDIFFTIRRAIAFGYDGTVVGCVREGVAFFVSQVPVLLMIGINRQRELNLGGRVYWSMQRASFPIAWFIAIVGYVVMMKYDWHSLFFKML